MLRKLLLIAAVAGVWANLPLNAIDPAKANDTTSDGAKVKSLWDAHKDFYNSKDFESGFNDLITGGEYVNNNDRLHQIYYIAWILGAYFGMEYENQLLSENKKSRLFCVPEKVALTKEQILKLVDGFISNNKEHYTPMHSMDQIVGDAFIDAFPCAP